LETIDRFLGLTYYKFLGLAEAGSESGKLLAKAM
jgi:hypothetical protein